MIKQLEENISHNSKQTFDLLKINLPIDEVVKLITRAYQGEVEKRGNIFLLNSDLQKIFQQIASWMCIPNKNPFLLIGGSVGNGKTTLAKAVIQVNNLYWKHRKDLTEIWKKPYKYLTATELNNTAKTEQKDFKEIKECNRLLLDDIGTESVSIKDYGNVISPFTEVIYHRYDKGLQTILTTNLTLEQIKERYGERVFDRMQEANRVFFTHKSYRLK